MSVEDYQFQLEQVSSALESDPENEELVKLKQDIMQLIELLQSAETAAAKPKSIPTPATSNTASNHKTILKAHLIGDVVLAKWSDANYYEAMIVSVLPDSQYELVFTGLDSIQIMSSFDIREPRGGDVRPVLLSSKEVQVGEIKQAPPEAQKKKRQKKEKSVSKRDVEDKARTSNWQSFAAKNVKKTLGGVGKKEERSAGQGSAPRSKHKYAEDLS